MLEAIFLPLHVPLGWGWGALPSRALLAAGVCSQAAGVQLGWGEKSVPIDETPALRDTGSSPAMREKKRERERSSVKSKALSALE